MSLGETRRGPTRPVRLHRRLLQPTTDPLCHRLQNARTSRKAGGVTPVSIKSRNHHRTPAPGREPPQAVAQGHVVHPAGGWRVCRPHGGRTRPLRRTTRSEASSDLLRREPGPTHRRDAQPIPAMPGQLERYDCEYKRNGTANLFILLDVHRSWRTVKVTDSRAAVDFAACMRELCDVHFPKAERIRVVLDNLSTHSAGALYQAFPAAEARRMLRRLEFHYTPKHASWLNMVEIEIGVLRSQCLDRRIATKTRLIAEVAAWERHRNASGARIQWMFTTYKARAKMGRAYPYPNES